MPRRLGNGAAATLGGEGRDCDHAQYAIEGYKVGAFRYILKSKLDAELEALIDSLGVVPRARYKHTIRHESVSLEEGFGRLQEGILRQIKKMEEKSRNPKPSKRKKSSKPKKTATKPQTPKAPEMQPFLPGFPQDND